MLSRISADISLLDDNIPWDVLYDLFNVMCDIPDIAGAKATKVLHKKRPALIPVYDSLMEPCCKKLIPGWSGMSWAKALIEYCHLMRKEALVHQSEIIALSHQCAMSGWPVSPIRVLEILTWTELDPSGEYR